VDALDPAFAPGTGTPEVGGLTTREALAILRGLAGLDVVGGDLEAIANDRYGAATREEISRSFASMFPITRQGSRRQEGVDALVLDDAAIEKIENETLLVHGRDDVIIPLQTSLDLLQKLQRPELHVFGRCRHWIMIEYRDAFNELLADFLSGYKA
jgi:2-hydroxymuconate-semialdehyde hydrolase